MTAQGTQPVMPGLFLTGMKDSIYEGLAEILYSTFFASILPKKSRGPAGRCRGPWVSEAPVVKRAGSLAAPIKPVANLPDADFEAPRGCAREGL